MSNDKLSLLQQFFKSPQSVGTVASSSRDLAEAMLASIDFSKLTTIVECGPGGGGLTAYIAEHLPATARYIGIEINQSFCERLSNRFPNLTFVNKSADQIESILRSFNIESADAIISGLPWASLPSAEQPAILNGIASCLRPGGVFVTYAFLQGLIMPSAWSLRRRLRNRFNSVETTQIIWKNMPPAFAYICRR